MIYDGEYNVLKSLMAQILVFKLGMRNKEPNNVQARIFFSLCFMNYDKIINI
jgi:hypothetical protein